jgi:hypothetical protein
VTTEDGSDGCDESVGDRSPKLYRRRSYVVSAYRLGNGNYLVTLPDGSRDTWLAEEFLRAFEAVGDEG